MKNNHGSLLKYFMPAKNIMLIPITITIILRKTIYYYYVSHRINTANKKLIFGNNKCNGILEYDRNKNKFYIVTRHNKLCDENIINFTTILQI